MRNRKLDALAIDEARGNSSFGIWFFGGAAIAMGIVALGWGDFATNWQRVGPDVPHRLALARAAGVYEVLAGAALLWQRTGRAGAALLTALYAVFALLWLVQGVRVPTVYDNWGNSSRNSRS